MAIKDSTPNADQFYETTRRVVDRARVFGPFMTVRGLEVLRTVGGDGFIGGGSVFGPPDAQFWTAFGAARSLFLRYMPAGPTICSLTSGCLAAGPAPMAPTKAS